MLNLNRASIIGHTAQEPELRTIPSGSSVANFSVATNRRWTNREGEQQEETEFHDIVAWGKLAEICDQIISKGDLVYAEGRLQTRSWEAQDGTQRRRTEIIATNVINLQKRQTTDMDQTPKKESLDQTPESKKALKKEKQTKGGKKKEEDTEEIDIDDIPL